MTKWISRGYKLTEQNREKLKSTEMFFVWSPCTAMSKWFLPENVLIQCPQRLFSFSSFGKCLPKVTIGSHCVARKEQHSLYGSDIRNMKKARRKWDEPGCNIAFSSGSILLRQRPPPHL